MFPITPDWIGFSIDEFVVPVELGKVREFAASLGAFFPQHFPAYGEPGIAPPTFLVTAAYRWGAWLERPNGTAFAELGLSDTYSLDGGQSFEFHGGPIRVGELLRGRTWIEDITEKQGRNSGLMFVTIRSDFRRETGELRATWRATSVLLEHEPGSGDVVPEVDLRPMPYTNYGEQRDQMLAIQRVPLESLAPGDRSPTVTMPPLTLTDIAAYGFASGEDGPAHHDVWAARAQGNPMYFSIGMLHAGLLATLVGAWLGPDRITRYSCRFRDMVWPGDVLTYSAEVAEATLADGSAAVTLDLVCRRNGAVVVSAQCECR